MSDKIKDYIFKLWIILSVAILCFIILFLVLYIFIKGIGSINFQFIFDRPRGIPLGTEGGIFPAIAGSLMLMGLSAIFASILAISTAIYSVFYCEKRLIKDSISLIIQCMAGTPSIVLGLFGYTFLVVYLRINQSLLTAAITLAVMIYPYIEVRLEKIFLEIDKSIINASYSLGISKFYTILKIVLPNSKDEIISTILLAGGLAMGATAPIILTGVVIFSDVPNSIFQPFMALPFHLYILINEGLSLDNAYGTALVLIALLLIINLLSLILKRKRGIDKWK